MRTVLLTCLMASSAAISMRAADPLVGAWRLNLQKSKGINPTISEFTRDGEYFRNTAAGWGYRFKLDGKDYPVEGNPQATTASWAKVDDRTFQHVMKKDGNVVYTVTTRVAADGKTRAWRTTRMLPNGGEATSEGSQELMEGKPNESFPLLGKWVMRPIMEIESHNDGVRMPVFGRPVSLKYDGSDTPVGGSGIADAVALRQVDKDTFEEAFKKSGKVVGTSTLRMSDAGRVLTIETKGTRADGQPFTSVAVYERHK